MKQVRTLAALAGVALALAGCPRRYVGPGPSNGRWSNEGNTISLRIEGLRVNTGQIRCGIFDQEAAFPERTRAAGSATSEVRAGIAVCEFRGMPAGDYAIAFHHDENSNGEVDSGLMGVPLEGYGFSNDARPVLGPPPWSAARFAYTGGALALRVAPIY